MVGGVQAGILAACIVLFLPMGMAGWHLSRNRVLFFSAALFITLAVGVHLMPYFPNLSDIFSSFTLSPSVDNSNSPMPCQSVLHEVDWEESKGFDNNNSSSFNGSRTWRWNAQAIESGCGFQRLNRTDTLDLLNGSWITVAGDSEARYLVLSLLELILESTESIAENLFKRHSDYEFVLEERGLKVDFIWAPFAVNLTRVLGNVRRGGRYPDVLVMGTGLWHMLHITNASHYGEALRRLQNSVVSILPLSPRFGIDGFDADPVAVQAPHMFWLGIPTLINGMLNTEAKRQKMTRETCAAYAGELSKSKLLRSTGGPLMLLDIESLSRGCGPGCTDDGMHYKGAVYEAAVQIMLNALLVESQQANR